MIRWDEDLHAVTQYVPDLKARRFALWLREWPETGLDVAALANWYDGAMDRQMQPDPQVNSLLGHLNDQQVPWGIVTNGPSRMQRHKCQALGLDRIAPFVIVSERSATRNRTSESSAMPSMRPGSPRPSRSCSSVTTL